MKSLFYISLINRCLNILFTSNDLEKRYVNMKILTTGEWIYVRSKTLQIIISYKSSVSGSSDQCQ